MQNCLQSTLTNQTIYDHGASVKQHSLQLISFLSEDARLQTNWKIPKWFDQYKKQIKENLLPLNIIEEYTLFHDCGKPYCLTIDENGRRHFPNHAEVSYKTWMSCGGSEQVGKLIKMDMLIHQMKAKDIDEFIQHPEAITLLLVGLSEIHANASMFGGIESESFKIKYSQIDKRGKAICQKIFGEKSEQII